MGTFFQHLQCRGKFFASSFLQIACCCPSPPDLSSRAFGRQSTSGCFVEKPTVCSEVEEEKEGKISTNQSQILRDELGSAPLRDRIATDPTFPQVCLDPNQSMSREGPLNFQFRVPAFSFSCEFIFSPSSSCRSEQENLRDPHNVLVISNGSRNYHCHILTRLSEPQHNLPKMVNGRGSVGRTEEAILHFPFRSSSSVYSPLPFLFLDERLKMSFKISKDVKTKVV